MVEDVQGNLAYVDAAPGHPRRTGVARSIVSRGAPTQARLVDAVRHPDNAIELAVHTEGHRHRVGMPAASTVEPATRCAGIAADVHALQTVDPAVARLAEVAALRIEPAPTDVAPRRAAHPAAGSTRLPATARADRASAAGVATTIARPRRPTMCGLARLH